MPFLTPTQLQIITLFPWRFGDLRQLETRDSFIFARVIAFASTAAFSAAACRVSVGEPVVGFLQPSSGDSRSAQLVGWHTCSLQDWQLTAGNTLPPSPWDLCSDTLYMSLNGPFLSSIPFFSGAPSRGSTAVGVEFYLYAPSPCTFHLDFCPFLF